jgi:hypothetical protein
MSRISLKILFYLHDPVPRSFGEPVLIGTATGTTDGRATTAVDGRETKFESRFTVCTDQTVRGKHVSMTTEFKRRPWGRSCFDAS